MAGDATILPWPVPRSQGNFKLAVRYAATMPVAAVNGWI
jgi:hypothetical protein